MPVGTKIRGISGELYSGSVKVAAMHDIVLDIASQTSDDSDHDSGSWGSKQTGINEWSIKADGWLLDGDTNQQALLDAQIAGTVLALKYRPAGTGSGKTEWSGNAVCSKFNTGAPQQGSQPLSLEFEGRGAIARGTQA
jgi:predicted secreted protein